MAGGWGGGVLTFPALATQRLAGFFHFDDLTPDRTMTAASSFALHAQSLRIATRYCHARAVRLFDNLGETLHTPFPPSSGLVACPDDPLLGGLSP